MKLTQAQTAQYSKLLDRVEAVISLAAANFPRDTSAQLTATGADASASASLPVHFLSFVVMATRSALDLEGKL